MSKLFSPPAMAADLRRLWLEEVAQMYCAEHR